MMRKRLIARYGVDHGERLEVVTVYEDETVSEYLDPENPEIPTIATVHPAAIWFERKLHDDFGIRIAGAFDRRPLVHQERFPQGIHPMRKSFTAQSIDFADYRPYKYEVVGGDGVFEVAVGPIHAGIIEPGHFHFSQAGEDMLHQEVRHFYKYRAVEKMVEGMTMAEAAPIIARISGNESVAYQIAWLSLRHQAAGREIDPVLWRHHALLLELERFIYHLTDLGFIPNDAGFGAALAWCSQRAEEGRRLMQSLTGHRFGFDAVGLTKPALDAEKVRRWIDKKREEMAWFRDWIVDIPSLWDRLDTTGRLRHEKAVKYDCVGVVARASGVPLDGRMTPRYLEHGFQMQTRAQGDVGARFKVRMDEVDNSLLMMEHLLSDESRQVEALKPRAGRYMATVESSLGELFMSVDLNEKGRITRFFARDPSFVNWQALHLMMPGNIIADFPLINKSCDLSYAGNDL